jgi:hypothetical protein
VYDPQRTDAVLREVREHRAWQAERYWETNIGMPDGTGPDVAWMPGLHYDAATIETVIREAWDWDRDPDPTKVTWLNLLREEIAEAFACSETSCLRTELVQVAAVAVSWIEALDARS